MPALAARGDTRLSFTLVACLAPFPSSFTSSLFASSSVSARHRFACRLLLRSPWLSSLPPLLLRAVRVTICLPSHRIDFVPPALSTDLFLVSPSCFLFVSRITGAGLLLPLLFYGWSLRLFEGEVHCFDHAFHLLGKMPEWVYVLLFLLLALGFLCVPIELNHVVLFAYWLVILCCG